MRAAREAANLTQNDLAEAAGYHLKQIREWESGRRIPQVDALAALAQALRLGSPLDLVHRDPDQPLTLRQLRTAVGLSQQQAADAAGMLRTTYSQIERGEVTSLLPEDPEAIGNALHVAPADVIAAHAAARSQRPQRPPTASGDVTSSRWARRRAAGPWRGTGADD